VWLEHRIGGSSEIISADCGDTRKQPSARVEARRYPRGDESPAPHYFGDESQRLYAVLPLRTETVVAGRMTARRSLISAIATGNPGGRLAFQRLAGPVQRPRVVEITDEVDVLDDREGVGVLFEIADPVPRLSVVAEPTFAAWLNAPISSLPWHSTRRP
jgi:hypothetical protein